MCLQNVVKQRMSPRAHYSYNDVVQQVVPWEKLEPGPVVTLKRVVATLRVQTFFWGWNRMIWTFGAKRQPSTTDPLRLTEMHMVVVCTWSGTEQGEIYSEETKPQSNNRSSGDQFIVLTCLTWNHVGTGENLMTSSPYEHNHFIKEDWVVRDDIIWAPLRIQNQSQVQQEAEEGGSY